MNTLNERRHALALMGATLLAAGLPASVVAQPARELRIGFQKYGTLTILKGRGTLEKRLLEKNVTVKWTEFPAGPVLLEGLNVGSIDFGTVGEAPPIFAQAAGANLVYVGHEPPSPRTEAIVVPKGSALRTLADLRGKKIAVNKGSNAHYLLVKALEKSGIAYTDVQVVFLAPADARAAFERGAVDAWSIWDPFLAAPKSSWARACWPTARAWCPTTSFTWQRARMRRSRPTSSPSCSMNWPRSMHGASRILPKWRSSWRARRDSTCPWWNWRQAATAMA
jgi:aliphatic sulfonates family ABC transporter substrate-binding protein